MTGITRRDALAGAVATGVGAAVLLPLDSESANAQTASTDTAAQPTCTLLLVNDIYKMGEVEGRGGFARLARSPRRRCCRTSASAMASTST